MNVEDLAASARERDRRTADALDAIRYALGVDAMEGALEELNDSKGVTPPEPPPTDRLAFLRAQGAWFEVMAAALHNADDDDVALSYMELIRERASEGAAAALLDFDDDGRARPT